MTSLINQMKSADLAWSVVWSATTVPAIDAGRGRGRTVTRRFDLRVSALLLAGCLAASPRPAAATLACGGLPFLVFLVLFVVLIGNSMRHFEVYLGEWTVGGPGCAFRVVPILDGIGIAMCLLSLMRATLSSAVAAIALLYVLHAINDQPLPFTQCRDFELATYPAASIAPPKPDTVVARNLPPSLAPFQTKRNAPRLRRGQYLVNSSFPTHADDAIRMDVIEVFHRSAFDQLVNASLWRALPEMYDYHDLIQSDDYHLHELELVMIKKRNALLCKPNTAVCDGTFHENFPARLSTPSYNFFYLDLMYIHRNRRYEGLNAKMAYAVLGIWALVSFSLMMERLKWNQLVWNNAYTWMVAAVAVWTLVVLAMAAYSVDSFADVLANLHSFLHLKSLVAAASALELALYTHACGFGSEIVLGKGLNYYAEGHSDSRLAKETIICSAWSISLCFLNGISLLFCSNKEAVHPLFAAGMMYGHTTRNLWIFPMYAACIPAGDYMHILTLFIFGGLMSMHVILTVYFVKTCIHCIFEYQVKLVIYELTVVLGICVVCCLLTLPYALRGGLFFLESMNNMLTGLTSTAICLLELVALFYMYNNRDFVTDIIRANASNKCPTRVFLLWKALPTLIGIALLLKIPVVLRTKQPALYSIVAAVPMLVILLSVPIKGIVNSIRYFKGRHRAE